MKAWALLSLLVPSAALAGPFTISDATSGLAQTSVTFQWPSISGAFTYGPVEFDFLSPTAYSGTDKAACDFTDAEDYCMSGTFVTDNSGTGTFVSYVSLDESSCTFGSSTAFAGSTYFLEQNAVCDMVQRVEATFDDTGFVYVFEGYVVDLDYTKITSLNGRRRGSPKTPSVSVTITSAGSPAAVYASGAMSGYDTSSSLVSGTFSEVP